MSGKTSNPYGPYFSSKELKSEKANEQQKTNLLLVTKYLLDPIRKKFGPVTITSAFRSAEENKDLELRGYQPSQTSQH
jgi:uncharacterized protein YcbK (DUF882 family)